MCLLNFNGYYVVLAADSYKLDHMLSFLIG